MLNYKDWVILLKTNMAYYEDETTGSMLGAGDGMYVMWLMRVKYKALFCVGVCRCLDVCDGRGVGVYMSEAGDV